MFEFPAANGSCRAPGTWSLPAQREREPAPFGSSMGMWPFPSAGYGSGGWEARMPSSSLPKQTRAAPSKVEPEQNQASNANANKAKSIRWIFPAPYSATNLDNGSSSEQPSADIAPPPALGFPTRFATEDQARGDGATPTTRTFSTYLDHQAEAPPDKVYTTLPLRGWVRCSEYVGELYPLMSVGSQLHAHGRCTPCKFYRSHRGCNDGQLCTLCHYPHWEMSYSEIRRAVKETGPSNRATLREFGFLSTSLEGIQEKLASRASIEIEKLATDSDDSTAGGTLSSSSSSSLSAPGSPIEEKLLFQCQPCSSSVFTQDKLAQGEPLLDGLFFEDEVMPAVMEPADSSQVQGEVELASCGQDNLDDEQETVGAVVRDSDLSSHCSTWSHQSQAKLNLESAFKHFSAPPSTSFESQASSESNYVHFSF